MLKTKLVDEYDGIHVASSNTEGWTDEQARNHDAAYAHALVMAIDEYENGPYVTTLTPQFILDRAAELMKELGYAE